MIAVLCLLGAGLLFFYEGSFKNPEQSKKQIKRTDQQSSEDINKRLQKTDLKQRVKRAELNQRFDNEVLTGEIEEDLKKHSITMPKGLDDRIDMTIDSVYQDMSMGNDEIVRQKLEDEVQRSLAEIKENQQKSDLQSHERDLFIRAFIENARRRGINIQIDEDLNVYTE